MSLQGRRHRLGVTPLIKVNESLTCRGLTEEQIAQFYAAVEAARRRKRK